MKTKYSFLAAIIILIGLLVHSQWRVHRLQGQLDAQTTSIRSIAELHARVDLSHGSGSYFLSGMRPANFTESFAKHFEQYGIKPIDTGCELSSELAEYSSANNRVVRDSLIKLHGKDLIQEFEDSYATRNQKQ